MNKPLIIKCNRMLSPEELEGFRKKWNSQMAANEVVVLPYGFELAEANVELLENIKAEIQGLIDFEESCCGNTTLGYECLGVIKKYIEELKGKRNESRSRN